MNTIYFVCEEFYLILCRWGNEPDGAQELLMVKIIFIYVVFGVY